ncbi:unnamed protein product [Sphagnum balticum]
MVETGDCYAYMVSKRYLHLIEDSDVKKKPHRFYILMSESVRTRTSSQCKSHHQKMVLRFKTEDRIIDALSPQLLAGNAGSAGYGVKTEYLEGEGV